MAVYDRRNAGVKFSIDRRNTNAPEILGFRVAASASEWTNHHSLALAATGTARAILGPAARAAIVVDEVAPLFTRATVAWQIFGRSSPRDRVLRVWSLVP